MDDRLAPSNADPIEIALCSTVAEWNRARELHEALLSKNNQGYWAQTPRPSDVLIATHGSATVGYVYGELNDRDAICHELGVVADVRRRGIATRLLRAFSQLCEDRRDITTVWVQPLDEVAWLRTFYRRRGFHGPEVQGHLQAAPVEILSATVQTRHPPGVAQRRGVGDVAATHPLGR